MKLRIILKIATVTSVVLLCMGFAISLYFKMSVKERTGDFDLYTVVPPDTRLLVDTDNVVDLMQRINELNCSKDNHFLYFSRFFCYLKEHINNFLDQTPHGLSKQMSKMLISFHEPEDDQSQVFYCRLGAGDSQFIEELIRKYSSTAFPSRFFDYRGEEIRIYPMPDDQFLACYVNRHFLALSYQKKLIERVIDTYLSKRSILSDETFVNIRSGHRMVAPATIYAHMRSIGMGNGNNVDRGHSSIGNWTEFNVNLNHDVIYLTGINYDADSCRTFINAIRKQRPISDFYGNIFPPSTFFLSKYSISDPEKMLEFTSVYNFIKASYSDSIAQNDTTLLHLLKEYAGSTMTTCMFRSNDTLSETPYAIASMPLKAHSSNISQVLKTLYHSVPQSGRIFTLPRNTLFPQLIGATDSLSDTYLFLYKDRLLVAPDTESLQAYVGFLERGHSSLEEHPVYEDIISSLSQSYNFMMMVDMGEMLEQPENYTRLIPNLFFRYGNFFRHFILTIQFTCDDDAVYPNLILTYKGASESPVCQ